MSRYENGERRLDPYECYILCNEMGVDFLEFMGLLKQVWDQESAGRYTTGKMNKAVSLDPQEFMLLATTVWGEKRLTDIA